MQEYSINDVKSEHQELPQSEPEKEIAPEHIVQIQQSAQQFSEIIAEIQQKMTSSRHLETVVSSWENVLNHLQHVASSLQNELYAKVASKEQFKDFYGSFVKLTSILSDLNKQLIVPEFKLHEQDASKTALLRRKAEEVINKMLVEISSVVKLHFLENFKKIEKIYTSMAARIKQEQELKEAQSRVEQQINISYYDTDYYGNYGTYDTSYDSGSADWDYYN
jgi:enamine deaminase RidA (YjgF/YER057c/UK114 family)